jgi:putative hydrolase of the HAD superfamily
VIDPPPLDPPPKAVLFDLDDTLCDYEGARAGRLRLAFSLGLKLDDEQREVDLDRMIAESIVMHPHGVDHFPELFSRFGCRHPESATIAAEWYRSNRLHGLALFPEAVRALQAARQPARGEPGPRATGIVTNGPADVQRAKVALLGVLDLVDFVIISGEFGVAKPDPAIFHEALRLAGVGPAETVYVGDSPEFDMAGARRAGIRSVWVNPHGNPWTIAEPGPHRTIRSIAELPRLLGPSAGREAGGGTPKR